MDCLSIQSGELTQRNLDYDPRWKSAETNNLHPVWCLVSRSSWSPDGKWLAYVSNQADSVGRDYGEIFVVSIDTGDVTRLTFTDGKVYDWRVSWGK